MLGDPHSSPDLRPGELRVRVEPGPVEALVTAVGEVDLATAPQLEAAVDQTARGRQDLVLDLSGLSFIDSTGLKLLMGLRRRTREQGTLLTLVVNPRVLRTLEVCGLAGEFEYDTVDGVAARFA